jgi:hypothetical protein
MKKLSLVLSSGILFTSFGCSVGSQKEVTSNTPAVVHAADAPSGSSPDLAPVSALPIPAVDHGNQQAWRTENVKDSLGGAVALKKTSLDGKYDLVILERGAYSFVSFARHTRWETVRNLPAKGKLMNLRAKFEDGEEQRIEWDELGFATANLCSVLWSYPAKTGAPIGPVPEAVTADSVGGDQLLIEEMMKHKTMLLEVEPGVTTQFDMAGLAEEIAKVRNPRKQPVLQAEQTTE